MYAAYGRNTIANARPKPNAAPEPDVRVFDMIEARRQRAIRAAQEERARRMRTEAFFREQKRIENGGGKLDHGSGGIVLLRAA